MSNDYQTEGQRGSSRDDDIALAQEYGINGVPALVFANKYLVSGAQPYSVLQQVIAQIQGEAP